LDILKEYLQTIAVFFTNIASKTVEGAKAFFGNVSNIVALNWAYVVNSNWQRVMFWFVFLISVVYIGLLVATMFMFRGTHEDRLRAGHETEDWTSRKKESKRRTMFMTHMITVGMALYLPVSQAAIEVWTCGGLTSVYAKTQNVFCIAVNDDGFSTLITGDDPVPDGWWLECQCSELSGYGALQGLSALLLAVFTCAFPIWAVYCIHKNQPRGSLEHPGMRYDEDGELVPYTDAMYRADLASQAQRDNPFNSLYKDYERKWGWYKVASLVLKLVVSVVVISLYGKAVTQTVVGMLVIACWAGLALYARPFLSDLADVSESGARLFAFLTLALTLVGHYTENEDWSAALVNLTQVAATILLCVCIVGDLPAVKKFLRNIRPRLVFEDSVGNTVGSGPDKIWPAWDLKGLRKETKHSIWHPLWLTLMTDGSKSPADVRERFRHNLAHTQDAGRDRIAAHWQNLTQQDDINGTMQSRLETRLRIQAELEGVDCHLPPALAKRLGSADKGKDVATAQLGGFGKLWVRPYPFTAYHVSDTTGAVVGVPDADAAELLSSNVEGGVAFAGRKCRADLRGLNGCTGLWFKMVRTESHRVPDGWRTVHYTDSEGHSHTRREREYSTVQVEMTYDGASCAVKNESGSVPAGSEGRIEIAAVRPGEAAAAEAADAAKKKKHKRGSSDGKVEPLGVGGADGDVETPLEEAGRYLVHRNTFKHGFSVAITSTGRGIGIGPKTGERSDVVNTHAFSPQEMGLIVDSDSSSPWDPAAYPDTFFAEFMRNNAGPAQQGQAAWETHCAAYRGLLKEERVSAQAVLTSAFWYFVYDNDGCDQAFLDWYFSAMEANPAVRALKERSGEAIGAALVRLRVARSSPQRAFWYCVFSDAWEMNQELKAVAQAKEHLDPASRTALCYRPYGDKDALIRELEERGLWKKSGKGLFNPTLVDALFAKLQELAAAHAADGGEAWAKVCEPRNDAGLDRGVLEGYAGRI